MSDQENLENAGRAMMLTWGRVKKAQARMWGDWMTIGEGLLAGRQWAMHQASTNKPEGKGFIMAYSEWLKRFKVDDMDKSDRAKLLQIMEERPAVEEWRASLTLHERLRCNNPTVAWRKWTAATRVKKPKPRSAGVSATEHGRARAIIDQQAARITELEEEVSATREGRGERSRERRDLLDPGTKLSKLLLDACGLIDTCGWDNPDSPFFDEDDTWAKTLPAREFQKFNRLAKKASDAVWALEKFVEEVEPVDQSAPEPEGTALVWGDCGTETIEGIERHCFKAPAGTGQYYLIPQRNLPGGKYAGYIAAYVGKPDADRVEDQQRQTIADQIGAADAAKAVAQKHYDEHREEGC
jgi:hypothetical protein